MCLHLTVFLSPPPLYSSVSLSANPVVLDKSRNLEGSGPLVQALHYCMCLSFRFIQFFSMVFHSSIHTARGIVCFNACDPKCEGHSVLVFVNACNLRSSETEVEAGHIEELFVNSSPINYDLLLDIHRAFGWTKGLDERIFSFSFSFYEMPCICGYGHGLI